MYESRKPLLLAYCKLTELADDPEVAVMLHVLHDSAVAYLENAGINEPEYGTPRASQYDLAVCYIVLDAWERRETSIAATMAEDNPAFRRMINQLKLTKGVRS